MRATSSGAPSRSSGSICATCCCTAAGAAPIHYHFEMKAWSETKIMVRFWILGGILCAAGFALYYRSYFRH